MIILKAPNLVRTYFSVNLEEEKVLELHWNLYSYFTKACNIQNTQYSKTISVYYCSSVLLNKGIQFFFHDTVIFLFVLLIV